MERTIRVTGKGKLSVKPDMIRLRINIEGMYEEYSNCYMGTGRLTEADVYDVINLLWRN